MKTTILLSLLTITVWSSNTPSKNTGSTQTNNPVETQDIASLRKNILHIAQHEIGVKEATGHNDGKRVEEYLRYTGLGKGHAWCAAFVSWCYGKAGISQPRNAWSPALFPKARSRFTNQQIRELAIHPADLFGIYDKGARRINHVGLVKDVQGKFLMTIEGNSNNQVESRRRHLRTVYALADWLD